MKKVLVILFFLGWAQSSVALVLTDDTRWAGKLSFDEDVVVPAGIQLSVAPGTVVDFDQAALHVSGTLVAREARFTGTGWGGIVLKGTGASTQLSDVHISRAKVGITVQGGSPVFDRMVFSANDIGLELRGQALGQVTNSSFLDNDKVGLFVKDNSTTAIVACRFTNNGRFGAYLYRANPQRFTDNRFVDNAVGLMIGYHGSDPTIEKNRFENNDIAVQVDRAARPTLQANRIVNNRTGLYVYRRSDPLVTGNQFQANGIGILIAYSSYPQIVGNDFVGNDLAMKLEYQSSAWEAQRGAQTRTQEVAAKSVFAGQGMRAVSEQDRQAKRLDGTVAASGNWWGPEGTLELMSSEKSNPTFIHDGRDQATFVDAGQTYPLDIVVFEPWRTESITRELP